MASYRSKIRGLFETKRLRLQLGKSGKTVVFTNGCFDILHPGHARYLEEAAGLGDHLIVAVNSDNSVRSIKGPKRPILNEESRAELVASLQSVGTVVIFQEDTPLEVIKELLPDVLVKGADWPEEKIVGADVVRNSGGRVERIYFATGFSTTSIIEKVIERYGIKPA